MRRDRRFITAKASAMLAVWATIVVATVAAQAPATPQAAPSSAPATAGAPRPQKLAEAESEPQGYTSAGRRDPFVSLLTRAADPAPAGKGSTRGIGGLTTDEISVRGVLQSRGAYLAMVQGADTRTYIARVSDRLIDGVITQITSQGLVIRQEINDPLSLVKQREVRKSLRSTEEGK